ncbi:MAG: right-handed parallel beta-helix repeat-containing protein [Myxococcota bacterium]
MLVLFWLASAALADDGQVPLGAGQPGCTAVSPAQCVIAAPGAYFIEEPLAAVGGSPALRIDGAAGATHVSIDLNGHTIQGSPTRAAIDMVDVTSVRLYNGELVGGHRGLQGTITHDGAVVLDRLSIRSPATDGVHLQPTAMGTYAARIDEVSVAGAGEDCVELTGVRGLLMRDLIATQCGQNGAVLRGSDFKVERPVIMGHAGFGLNVYDSFSVYVTGAAIHTRSDGAGGFFMNGSGNSAGELVLAHNAFSGGAAGIHLINVQNFVLLQNTTNGAGSGVLLSNAQQGVIRNHSASDNDFGLKVSGSGNVFTHTSLFQSNINDCAGAGPAGVYANNIPGGCP